MTHVIPYFCKDELECRQNEFEQNHDVDTFMFETPFTRNGTARGLIEEQWKRRTILTSNFINIYILIFIYLKLIKKLYVFCYVIYSYIFISICIKKSTN